MKLLHVFLCLLLVISSLFVCTAEFINPRAGKPGNIEEETRGIQDNERWPLGFYRAIKWEYNKTNYDAFEIRLCQVPYRNQPQSPITECPKLFHVDKGEDKATSFNWRVNLEGFHFDISDVFYFWFEPFRRNAGFRSHYIIITDPRSNKPSPTRAMSPTSGPASTLSISPTNSTSGPMSASSTLSVPPTTATSATSAPTGQTPTAPTAQKNVALKIAIPIVLGILVALLALFIFGRKHMGGLGKEESRGVSSTDIDTQEASPSQVSHGSHREVYEIG
ncbi:hypothetical protein CC80DRAFT_509303 [Byssothecium circinans]|uniref:Mid2 domain-containing protein n=1 Tax=Byssothecium circinans TaxID=147558 RepID=A0A6A5TPS5_9PLEO|nr:hypothetical protein CC80DRAFT_509303 [Byssothecium circinans]